MNSKDENDRNPCSDHQSGHVDSGCPDSGNPASTRLAKCSSSQRGYGKPAQSGYRKTDNCYGETKAFEIGSGTRFQSGRKIVRGGN